jgi:uncharacterized protein (DUF305 family)
MTNHDHAAGRTHHYSRLGVMLLLSFVAMYLLMYAMTNRAADAYANVNQAYMAALMTAPMALIELVLMRGMYTDRRLNLAIAALSVLVLAGAWVAIRQQAVVAERQFLRSMIPHHSGAILMCQRADINDAEVAKLCETIVAGQQQEIDQMNAILSRLR